MVDSQYHNSDTAGPVEAELSIRALHSLLQKHRLRRQVFFFVSLFSVFFHPVFSSCSVFVPFLDQHYIQVKNDLTRVNQATYGSGSINCCSGFCLRCRGIIWEDVRNFDYSIFSAASSILSDAWIHKPILIYVLLFSIFLFADSSINACSHSIRF